MTVHAYGWAADSSSWTNSDIGFNSSCSDIEEAEDVTAGASSQSETFTLHVCDSQYSGGGTVEIVLAEGQTVLAWDFASLEARPITVRIQADNPFPVTSGTADERTVTLTAVMDAPASATFAHYQWQEKGGSGTWSNLGATLTSSTHALTATTATTKTVRVVVKEMASDTESFTSDVVSITWDLRTLVNEITEALTSGLMPSSSDQSVPRAPVVPDTPHFGTLQNDLWTYVNPSQDKFSCNCRSGFPYAVSGRATLTIERTSASRRGDSPRRRRAGTSRGSKGW